MFLSIFTGELQVIKTFTSVILLNDELCQTLATKEKRLYGKEKNTNKIKNPFQNKYLVE